MKKVFLSFWWICFMMFLIPITIQAANTDQIYRLENLYFTTLNGDVITDPTGSCMAAVMMTNISANNRSGDQLIIAAYSSDNLLISFNILSSSCESWKQQSFSALINVPDGIKLGHIKAYVWDNIETMHVLSNMLFAEFNPLENLQKITAPITMVDPSTYQLGTGNGYICIYASSDAPKPIKYYFNPAGAQLYVNGIHLGILTEDYFRTYIRDKQNGKIELVDTYTGSGPADGYYDIVNVTRYATVRVESVLPRTGQIFFSKRGMDLFDSFLTLAKEDTRLEYTIRYNGHEIGIEDLQKDDILTIVYDVTHSFSDSRFYQIYVSRNTVTGTFCGTNNSDQTIYLDNDAYEVTEYQYSFDDLIDDLGLILSRRYTAYLDVSGKIFDMDQIPNVEQYAIADGIDTSGSYDNYGLTLYFADGTWETFNVTPNINGWETPEAAMKQIYSAELKDSETTGPARKRSCSNRVFEFRLDSNGNIKELVRREGVVADSRFKAATNSVGCVYMNADTAVINTDAYYPEEHIEDLKSGNTDFFVNNTDYTVYGFCEKNIDGTYPMVIIEETGPESPSPAADNTRLAVLTSYAAVAWDNGRVVYTLTMLTKGEKQSFTLSENAVLKMGDKVYFLDKNDVVVYTLNAKGEIETLDTIFEGELSYDWAKFQSEMQKPGDHSNLLLLPSNKPAWTTEWLPAHDMSVQIAIGPVIHKSDNSFSIGKVYEDKSVCSGPYTDLNRSETQDGGILHIGLNDDTAVYVYDYSYSSQANLFAGTNDDILRSTFTKNNNIIMWEWGVMNIAIAKVVDGTAQDVFIFTGGQYD